MGWILFLVGGAATLFSTFTSSDSVGGGRAVAPETVFVEISTCSSGKRGRSFSSATTRATSVFEVFADCVAAAACVAETNRFSSSSCLVTTGKSARAS